MTGAQDIRLEQAKAVPIEEVAQRLGIEGLRRFGVELVGPCPTCGGTDRFGINTRRGVFQCRKQCSASPAGDQIALVRHVLGVDFRAALDWLCGPAEAVSEAELAERRRKARESRERAERIGQRMRANSIRDARNIWFAAQDAEGTPVREYLTRRGIDPDRLRRLPPSIRYQPEARYVFQREVLHVGPAMVCAVVDAGGRVTAVHRTYIDLDQPKGKLIISEPGNPERGLPSKKVLGSKKGAVVRILTPQDATVMVMAEGVENTLTAMLAEDEPRAHAYWCGVDLGNMSGRMKRGPGLKYAGLPDMNDGEAWIAPPWVRQLVFVQDGDSEPRMTRARLESGLRRSMARNAGLIGRIAHAGEGRDLNDIVMGVE